MCRITNRKPPQPLPQLPKPESHPEQPKEEHKLPSTSSQFNATKIWRQTIANFRHGIKLKHKRRSFHSFEECFSGEEAVAWFHAYAQGCAASHQREVICSDEPTLKLIEKLVQSKILVCHWSEKDEPERNVYCFSSTKDIEEDTDELFRVFVAASS